MSALLLGSDIVVAGLPWHGPGRLVGTTVAAGSPVMRRVRLFDLSTGRLVRETWSAADTGVWQVDGLALDRDYFVVAHDHTGLRDAVIHDRIRAGVPS